MREMQFQEPVFHPGLNLTVRKGPKWSDLRPGDLLELVRTGSDGPSEGFGTVVFAWTGQFSDLPDYWLTFEHSPEARTREDLKAGMDSIYGSDWENECVAILFWY